ncbi:UvrD-helicase domain-containing protein [Parasphaerochaeta coccoides]|uniref:DNA 3'-5' helicase II n=1 Tax=Parasphaerochaeta coccoides (strain ATCC BAA-1237 / DSM 17374 / SPN1) TaxID=760011 RepID=F4GKL9_PARC1|nr:UvrD-helicase domain-containing protein [Parasphaerochaeta coccoides]AEC01428.1 UvrD/REP helicase [Parasphaerochaeta coccoides DSM 17374]
MDLNHEQKAAVEDFTHNLLILAASGSGKTRVITEKVIHAIREKGYAGSEILAITFTRKAATEMQERLRTGLDEKERRGLTAQTFHAYAAHVLRTYGWHIGLPQGWKIADGLISPVLHWQIIKNRSWEILGELIETEGGTLPALEALAIQNYLHKGKD